MPRALRSRRQVVVTPVPRAAGFTGGSFLATASGLTVPVGGAFTIAGWFNGVFTNGQYAKLWAQEGGSVATDMFAYQFDGTANNPEWSYSNNASYFASGGTAIANNTWYFAATVYEFGAGNQIRQYLYAPNRQLFQAAGSGGMNNDPASTAFRLGAYVGGVSPYTGLLRGLAYWTRALPTSDMDLLYNNGVAMSINQYQGTLMTSLVSGWDLAGPASDGLWHDSVGTRHLTPNGEVRVVSGRTR